VSRILICVLVGVWSVTILDGYGVTAEIAEGRRVQDVFFKNISPSELCCCLSVMIYFYSEREVCAQCAM